MRRITLAMLGSLAFLTGAVLTSSCSKKDSTPLEQVQIIDNQLSGFSLLTDDSLLREPLAKTAFTIRHSQTGQITNPQALPYSADDYKVRLNIQTVSRDAVVDVITADGKTTRWTSATQTFSSADILHGIRLRISQNSSATDTSSDPNAYTYQVTFKRYASDPHTFAWSTGTATGLPAFAQLLGSEQAEDGTTTVYYRTTSGTSAASRFTSPTGAWTSVALSGLGAGEELVSIIQLGGTTYATTSAHKLYRGQGGAFTAISLPADAPAPVSVLAGAGQELFLVGQGTTGASVFARYDLSSGKVTSHGHQPQSEFPVTGGISYTGSSVVYQGAYTYLAGGRTASGRAAAALWATTNGTDWLVVGGQQATSTEAIHQAVAQADQGQRLYRFATTTKGLAFTLSRDGGATWEEARSTALTGLTVADFASYPVFAWASADGTTVYLLRGAKTASEAAQLYIGQFGGLRTTTD